MSKILLTTSIKTLWLIPMATSSEGRQTGTNSIRLTILRKLNCLKRIRRISQLLKGGTDELVDLLEKESERKRGERGERQEH